MDPAHSEGLGLSLTIYMAALLGALALVAVPVYYANAPTVLENTAATHHGSSLTRPLYADRRDEPFPLALLKRQELPDPASLAALNSYAQASAPQPRRATTNASTASGTPVAARQPQQTREQRERTASSEYAERQQQPRRSFFPFFSLF